MIAGKFNAAFKTRPKFALGILIGVMLIMSTSSIQPLNAQTSSTAPCPAFDSSNFSNPTAITNRLFPMQPGEVFVYSGTTSGHPVGSVVTITHDTRILDGVTTIVVNDTVRDSGKIVESTLDYYAQDNSGNVWYFGEDALQIKNGKVIGTEGSWLAGVNGAQPGFIMEAHPKVGDFYCQENAPGAAQDQAKVISVSSSVCVPWVCTNNHVLLTEETSPLDPGTIEDKWYTKDSGNAMSKDIAGGQDQSQLVAILQT